MYTRLDDGQIVAAERVVEREEYERMLFVDDGKHVNGELIGDERVEQQVVVDDELRGLVDLRLALQLVLQVVQSAFKYKQQKYEHSQSRVISCCWVRIYLFLLLESLERQLDHLTRVQIHDAYEYHVAYAARALEELLERPHVLVVVLHQTGKHRHQQLLQLSFDKQIII